MVFWMTFSVEHNRFYMNYLLVRSSWVGGFALMVLLASASVYAGNNASDVTVGIPWTGEAGIRETSREFMVRPGRVEQGRKIGRILRVGKLGLVEHVEYVSPVPPVNPPNSSPFVGVSGSGAQSVTNAFLGATFADCLAYPPDTMGAVGPSQFIVAVNGRIRSFNKNTGVACPSNQFVRLI